MLLEVGARVNARCPGGHTPYWHALASSNLEIQEMLIRYRATKCPEPTPKERGAINMDLLEDRFTPVQAVRWLRRAKYRFGPLVDKDCSRSWLIRFNNERQKGELVSFQ